MVWYVWFGFVNEADLKRPLIPLKVAKARLELHFGTIPAWVGSVRVGPIVILKLTQSNCAGTGTELGKIPIQGGSVPQSHKSTIQNVDYFDMRGEGMDLNFQFFFLFKFN